MRHGVIQFAAVRAQCKSETLSTETKDYRVNIIQIYTEKLQKIPKESSLF